MANNQTTSTTNELHDTITHVESAVDAATSQIVLSAKLCLAALRQSGQDPAIAEAIEQIRTAAELLQNDINCMAEDALPELRAARDADAARLGASELRQ